MRTAFFMMSQESIRHPYIATFCDLCRIPMIGGALLYCCNDLCRITTKRSGGAPKAWEDAPIAVENCPILLQITIFGLGAHALAPRAVQSPHKPKCAGLEMLRRRNKLTRSDTRASHVRRFGVWLKNVPVLGRVLHHVQYG